MATSWSKFDDIKGTVSLIYTFVDLTWVTFSDGIKGIVGVLLDWFHVFCVWEESEIDIL